MLSYIAKRLVAGLITVWFIATATFIAMHLVPGDPLMNQKAVSAEIRLNLERKYGLDKPVVEQYFIFLGNMLTGDFGISYTQQNRKVNDIIKDHFPVSATLGILAIFFATLGGILWGAITAVYKNRLPDIIIMDIKMPELNGVEATKAIATQYPEINIIALTTYNTKPFIRNMIDVGASAYLVKNSPTQKVLHTIKQVYYHGFYYDNLVMEALKGTHNGSKLDKRTVFDEDFITQREKEVLEQICLQKTSQEIAEALFISKRTVEVHRKNLLEKTGAKNIAGLVIFAIQNNLVSPIIIE